MTKKMKRRIRRVFAGAFIFLGAILIPEEVFLAKLLVFLLAYLMIGGDVLKNAVRGIGQGQLFDENFLMGMATVGAFLIGEYPEAVAVMLFYQVGEIFQSYAVNRSRKSITELMDIRPDYANWKQEGGIVESDPAAVPLGARIVIRPGERVPLDGIIMDGSSSLDTKALTGEALPRDVGMGDEVISGCINLSGLLEVQVEKEYGESTVSKILDLVENASSKKAEAENFITKFARYYTPAVVACALLLALLPPLLLGNGGFSIWIYRALSFLVISCPCALVISVPLSFFGGLGGASRRGILIKGSNYLESLSLVRTIVFDKTGTLTKGNFAVTKLKAAEAGRFSREELLEAAAYAEAYSTHPIGISLREAYGRELELERIGSVREESGEGVEAVFDGQVVLAGNSRMMKRRGISYEEWDGLGTAVYLVIDGQYAGYALIQDEIKTDAKRAITLLKQEGIKKTVMLTGDRKKTGEAVAKQLGIDEVYTELLPADKVERIEGYLGESSKKQQLAFVGDGINDAPVLARADLGIAMGGLGSDAAIEAADIVIMTDEPSKIAEGIRISRKTMRIVKQNIIFALFIKVFVLILAALGAATMWSAVFADVGVTVLAILNALRALQSPAAFPERT